MCQNCLTIAATSTEELGGKFVNWINGSAMTMMCSIGHRTGLFDALSGLDWSTSDQIADAADLNERYVREWLGAMVTGGLVDYNPDTKTYKLPTEHAALLTRSASPNNLASVAQWVSVLGEVESDVVECFRNGGGVPYERYSRFHPVMAEESGQSVVSSLEEHILPLVPGLIAELEAGIDVIDFGCGSGWAMVALAQRFPASTFRGIDISEEAVTAASRKAGSLGLRNVTFDVVDAASLGERNRYDLVTAFDIVHDQADPESTLRSMHSCLKPGGSLLMQDIKMSTPVEANVDNMFGPFIYTISTMHCMTVSLAQGGRGLGAAWGRELALEMLGDAGFSGIAVNELDHDELNYFYVSQK